MILCPSCAKGLNAEELRCLTCGFKVNKVDGFVAWSPELAVTGSGFRSESFAYLAELEASNFWFRARNKIIVWALRFHFGPISSLFEVGCGTGYVLSGIAAEFPNARLVGSEIFVAGLKHAAVRLPTATLVQLDAKRIPYVDEFDVAIAVDVIEHIDQDEKVLSQLFCAVKPGGGILISAPQHKWLWSQADEYACHVRRYNSRDLHRKIREAGFVIQKSTSFVTFLLPLMLASRLQNRKSVEFDPQKEFDIPRWVNFLLEIVLLFELVLIKIGISFPVGGSRLVVARKPNVA